MILADLLGTKYPEQIKPDEPVPAGAEVAGTLSDDLQNLFTNYAMSTKNLQKIYDGKDNPSELSPELLVQISVAMELRELFQKIFWFELRAAYGLQGKPEVGVGPNGEVWFFNEVRECDCPNCTLRRSLERLTGLTVSV